MSWLNLLIEKSFINGCRFLLFGACFFGHVTVKAWEVDLSRRRPELNQRSPASGPPPLSLANPTPPTSVLSSVFESTEPTQEIVILNTEKGFVPATINLRSNRNYKFHIVNVNESQKNTSFVLDAFSQHHGTFFGQPKTFEVAPKAEGIFSFQCPETAFQGRIVVTRDESSRKPAGE